MYKLRTSLTLLLICAIGAPHTAAAAIVINEIAWMGSVGNANAEWIELYNDATETVSLSGWTLTSAGTAPNISLSGTIAGNGFYLLERTSDASVPTISADQIYTGALGNGGDTLTLKDSSGAMIDQVVGGTNWASIGGDNTSKQTPQRNGSSWTTAAPTPRALNGIGEAGETPTETATTTPPVETATTTPTTTIGGSTPVRSAQVESPVRQLFLDAGPDRIVVAGVATPFSAVAYTKNGSIRDARITWSFGDGGRELGEDVRHTFRRPGEYLVAVRAQERESEVLVALRVVVDEAAVSVAATSDGVLLSNNSTRLVDLSGWRLLSGDEEFTIPEDTGLWPGASVVFSYEDIGLRESERVALLFPNGKMAGAVTEQKESQEQPEAPPPGIQRVQTSVLPAPINETVPYEPVIDAPAAPELQAAVGAAVPAVPSSWLMCLFGGLLACGASLVVR